MSKDKEKNPNALKYKSLDLVSKELIQSKCFTATALVDKMRTIGDVLTKADFGIKVDVITYKDPNKIFIPTGTKDKPSGLTNTEAEVIAFVEYKTRTQDFPHSFMNCVTTKDLKEFLKVNWKALEKGIDKDFETAGVYVMFNFLEEIVSTNYTITQKK